MTSVVTMALNKGPFTAEERERIAELADMGWKLNRTARAMNRSSSSVSYYYVKLGYRPATQRGQDHVRKGRPVYAFTEEEDRAIETMSRQGMKIAAIGREMGVRFGRPRAPNSVAARLQMLAARDDAG